MKKFRVLVTIEFDEAKWVDLEHFPISEKQVQMKIKKILQCYHPVSKVTFIEAMEHKPKESK